MKKFFNFDVKDIMNTVSTAAAATLLQDFLFAGKKDGEKDEDTMRLIRNILIVVGAVVVVAGAVYAIVRFLQPKEEKEGGYCFLCGKKKKAKAAEALEEDVCGEAEEEAEEDVACEEAAEPVCACGCAKESAEAAADKEL